MNKPVESVLVHLFRVPVGPPEAPSGAHAKVEVMRATPLGPAGTVARGHEFHASRIDEVPDRVPRAYRVRTGRGGPPRAEGYLIGETLMSYVHLHFGSNPAVPDHLVRHVDARRRDRRGAKVTITSSKEEAERE